MATRHILLAVSPPNQRNVIARLVAVRAVHRTIPFLPLVIVTFLQGLHSIPWSTLLELGPLRAPPPPRVVARPFAFQICPCVRATRVDYVPNVRKVEEDGCD